jgi:disulfide bond formation protein DsbB
MPLALDDPRILLRIVLTASAGALAAAFAGQYIFGLEPCVLCLYQRLPWAAAVVVAVTALLAGAGRGRARPAVWPVLLCAGLFAAGSVLALYHVGVEEHWWGSLAGCAGTPVGSLSIEDLRAEALASAPRPCDRVDFRLFGLSLAGWNAIMSTLLAGCCLYGYWSIKERQRA